MASEESPPASRSRVFIRRASSTLILWLVVGGVFASRMGWMYFGLVTLLSVVAAGEYFGMLRKAGLPCFPKLGLGVCLLYSGVLGWDLVAGGTLPAAPEGCLVACLAAGAFTLCLRKPVQGTGPLLAVALTLLGFVYACVMFQFSSRIIFLDGGEAGGRVSAQGAHLLLWLIAVTKFTDTGAYITGSLVGRHKMIPHISPGKTWEGFAGAFVFAQLVGCGLYALFPESLAVLRGYGHVVALVFLLGFLAVIGDLAESVVKRALAAKDSGKFLPGIGGSLDLIDSICFTAPALYFYLQWIP